MRRRDAVKALLGLLVPVSAGTVKVNMADGKSMVFEEKVGDTNWSEPAPRHFVENIGPTPVKTVLIEIK